MWAEKYRGVVKEGGRLWHLLLWEKQQSPPQALYSSRRCCQLNNTSLQGHEVARSQARPALSLPGQALCWLQHTLTKGTLFLPRKRQSTSFSTFSLSITQLLVFTSFCCLSVSLLRLLLGNVFDFLPRVRFRQVTLALPPLVEQNENYPLWCDKPWHLGAGTDSLLRNGS